MLNSSAYTASSPAALQVRLDRFYRLPTMTDTMRSPIEVVPYDSAWPQTFDRIRADLLDALRGVAIVGIEHVGSTAVEGLRAKPIIDVDIVVDRDAADPAIRALERAGYLHRGELGIVDRHSMAEPDPPARNVYVVVAGSLALRNHLAVRDALRAEPSRPSVRSTAN
jgi:GrpB-like predicted nucleotidyltransferase (UPF0157 family)